MITNQALVCLDSESCTKEEIIDELVSMVKKENKLTNSMEFVKSVYEREKQTSTALGHAIAIPHGKSTGVKEAFVAFARTKKPILWNEELVELVFLIGVPEDNKDNIHLQILAELSRKLIDDDFREKLKSAKTKQEVEKLLIAQSE